MFSTATSPATSLRRVHDDVGRPARRRLSHQTGLGPTADTPPTCAFLHFPSSMGVSGDCWSRRQFPASRFGAAGIACFGDILKNRGAARGDRVPFGLYQFGGRLHAVTSGTATLSGDTNSDPLPPVLIPTPIMPSCYRLSTPLSGSFLVFTWVLAGSVRGRRLSTSIR